MCIRDSCPNRANVEVIVPGKKMPQIVHVDIMCNECGNCKVFCPYSSAPYKDKFTVFATEAEFDAGSNPVSYTHLDVYKRQVLQRACTHAAGPYNYHDVDIVGYGVYTNNIPAGAYRGFGVTQSCFATECNINPVSYTHLYGYYGNKFR